jgi:hypothetical protein
MEKDMSRCIVYQNIVQCVCPIVLALLVTRCYAFRSLLIDSDLLQKHTLKHLIRYLDVHMKKPCTLRVEFGSITKKW